GSDPIAQEPGNASFAAAQSNPTRNRRKGNTEDSSANACSHSSRLPTPTTPLRSDRWANSPPSLSNPLDIDSMLGQPGLALCIIRHRALHAQPERRRVVRLVQVGNLVHHHVLGNARRQQDRLPVEVQPVALSARSP